MASNAPAKCQYCDGVAIAHLDARLVVLDASALPPSLPPLEAYHPQRVELCAVHLEQMVDEGPGLEARLTERRVLRVVGGSSAKAVGTAAAPETEEQWRAARIEEFASVVVTVWDRCIELGQKPGVSPADMDALRSVLGIPEVTGGPLTDAAREIDPSLHGPRCECGHVRLDHWGPCSFPGCLCLEYRTEP